MSHTMTRTEMYALHHFAVALRPDWHHNRCGSTWQNHLGGNTFPHATDFLHAMRALHNYATMQTADGTPVKRTPKYFPDAGPWWDQTKPTETAPTLPPCDQHGTDYGNKESCTACWSEIKAGTRPHDKIGKIYTLNLNLKVNPAVGRPPRSYHERPYAHPHATQTGHIRDENRARTPEQP